VISFELGMSDLDALNVRRFRSGQLEGSTTKDGQTTSRWDAEIEDPLLGDG